MSEADAHPALQEAARSVLAEHDLVLEELVVRPRPGGPEVSLVVDLPEDRLGSADLDAVAAATTDLNAMIDADDSLLGPDPAVLEVTTPGVDRPLTAARHFRRARGRLLVLSRHDGEVHRARMLAVQEDGTLVLRPEPGRDEKGRPVKLPKGTPDHLEIPVDDVEHARVEVEFDPPEDLEALIAEAENDEQES